jgi:polar amino acid transport system ATP-binding protein
LIALCNIVRGGDLDALAGLSLEVPAGQLVCLISSAPAARVAALRSAVGLARFDAGEVRLGEERLGSDASEERWAALRRRVAYVSPEAGLFPHLSLLDNLCLAPRRVLAEPASSAQQRAEALLRRFGLHRLAGLLPLELSPVDQRRALYARALMMRPEALVLAEPTSGLEPSAAGDLRAMVRDLADQDYTILVSTDCFKLAGQLSHRVAMLDAGYVVEQGTPGELLENPQHPATRAWITASRG